MPVLTIFTYIDEPLMRFARIHSRGCYRVQNIRAVLQVFYLWRAGRPLGLMTGPGLSAPLPPLVFGGNFNSVFVLPRLLLHRPASSQQPPPLPLQEFCRYAWP